MTGAVLGADQREGSTATLGFVEHVETIRVDGVVQMLPQVLAYRESLRACDRILAERAELRAQITVAVDVASDRPICGSTGGVALRAKRKSAAWRHSPA